MKTHLLSLLNSRFRICRFLLTILFLAPGFLEAQDLDNDGRPDDLQLAMGSCLGLSGSTVYGINTTADCFARDDLVVEFWIRPEDTDQTAAIVEFGGTGEEEEQNFNWTIECMPGGAIKLKWEHGNGTDAFHTYPDMLVAGEWQHITFWRKPVGNNYSTVLLRNGTQVWGSIWITDMPTGGSGGNLKIASYGGFRGQLDELRIWASTEAGAHEYQLGFWNQLVRNGAGLQGVFTFDEDSSPCLNYGASCTDAFFVIPSNANAQLLGPQLDCDEDDVPDLFQVPACNPVYLPECDPFPSGLLAQYYDNTALTNPVYIERVPTVDRRMNAGTIAQSMPGDFFSARYQGQMRVPQSSPITLRVWVDDGCRLEVDGQLLIDEWVPGGTRLLTVPFSGMEDEWVPIQLEYFENAGQATLVLEWETDAGIEVIPETRLRYAPQEDCDGNGETDSCELLEPQADCNGNGLLDACEILDDAGLDCNGNGWLDSCELLEDPLSDCNANGLLDGCEIDLDPGLDTDADGWIDSCQMELFPVQDANGDGIFDHEQLLADPSLDCNGNGLRDSYELLFPDVLQGYGAQTMYYSGTEFDRLRHVALGVPGNQHLYGDTLSHPSLPDEGFSVRWSGFCYPWCQTGYTETLSIAVEGGLRCWVDGELQFDDWTPGYKQFEFEFESLNEISLVIEYANFSGPALVLCEDYDTMFCWGPMDAGQFQAQAADQNGNGILDDCEGDCNGNGTPDAQEIALDPGLDCDNDGLLDTCQWKDCNGDGEDDRLQICADPGLDCNANGLLDACEVQDVMQGMKAEYYAGIAFDSLVATELDGLNANGSWEGSPHPLAPADSFSIRWSGTLVADVTGTHNLNIGVDSGGYRLWLDGVVLYESWQFSHGSGRGFNLYLEAGEAREIVYEIFHTTGSAGAQMHWNPPGGDWQMLRIPVENLSWRGQDSNGNGVPDDCDPLPAPVLTIERLDPGTIRLSWTGVQGAMSYSVYETLPDGTTTLVADSTVLQLDLPLQYDPAPRELRRFHVTAQP